LSSRDNVQLIYHFFLQVDKWNPGWAQPERVIKRRQVTDGGICRVEWLVKWTGLGYEQCTWEPADAGILASPDMSKLFLAYEQWTKAASDRISCKRIEEVCDLLITIQ
jgi:chromodomain-helicase-DNA-binding protein 3